MNYRLIARNLGNMALALGAAMFPSIVCGVWYEEGGALLAFALSMALCAALGIVLRWAGRNAGEAMHQRESLALVGFSWIVAAVLGALPFVFAGTLPSFIDAVFESMSGFTTTGSTVLADIEAAPRSVLFWRAFIQWLGGIGIVVLFIAVLPYLGAGGKQLFRLESPGPESRTFRPHIRDTAKFLCQFYGVVSAALTLLLWAEGMTLYEALCHTFTTVSTGGFSTRQASVAAFDSLAIELTLVVFMIIAAMNFGLFFVAIQHRAGVLTRDAELRVFLGILLGATLLMTANLMGAHGPSGPAFEAAVDGGLVGGRYENIEDSDERFGTALRKSIFQATSIMTTTGFVTDDFDLWPHFSRSTMLFLMFVGGCAGSTAGGFKVVRLIMLVKMAYWRLEASFRPKTIRLVKVGDEVVEEEIQRRVSGFFVLYLGWVLVGTLLMSSFGLPFESSIAAVLATMNNIGPGLGLVGANVDFHLLPPIVKVFLTFAMLLGRLEIFTLCVLLVPSFWRGGWLK